MKRGNETGIVGDPGPEKVEEWLRHWRRSGTEANGWLFRTETSAVGPLGDGVPIEPGDPWEWRVEVSALEPDHPEVVVVIDVRLRGGELWVKSLRFSVTGAGEDYNGTDLFRRLRLGSMHAGLRQVLPRARPSNVSETAWQLELAKPGRAGHPDRYYAEWVAKYLAAIEEHGARRYMPGLLAENPGYTAKNVRRAIDRAEQLGLITERPGPGKAGGAMTKKCERLLEEG